jgi:predicted esterase
MFHPKLASVWLAFLCGGASLLAAEPKPTRFPPPGLAIAEQDRMELTAGVAELAAAIERLRGSPHAALLPDVIVYHKAVDWALRYDEFYRTNEPAIARSLLKRGLERARHLEQGRAPWLSATGLIVRGYISRVDGSVQPYGLVVPASLAANSKTPRRLDVWLHGRDEKLTDLKFIADRERNVGEFAPPDTIVLHPYGRNCNAFKLAGETDVFEALEHVKQTYAVDDKRMLLRGFSMGGAGVWHITAHYPDRWAAAAPGAGFAETPEYSNARSRQPAPESWEQTLWQVYDATAYAANFTHLPVTAYSGTQDKQRQAGDVMERALRAEGLELHRVWGTNIGHKYTPESKREIESFLAAALANDKPPRSGRFTTRTLRYHRGAQVEIHALERHWTCADVEWRRNPLGVEATTLPGGDSRYHLRTTNVLEFSLLLPTSSARFTIDGQQVVMWGEGATRFRKDGRGRWAVVKRVEESGLAKTHGLQGPIDDAFLDSFLFVRATGEPKHLATAGWLQSRLAKATNDWRGQFRGEPRVKDDVQVTDADMAAHHLVLFGDPESNRLLKRMSGKLPVEWNRKTIKFAGQSFDAATHVPVFIFPNPLNPKRYVVVNTGFTFADVLPGSNAQQTPKLPDAAVLSVPEGKPVMARFFDERWRVEK